MLTAGCAKGTEKEQSAGTTSGKALAEMNDIPADGIITKEQFQSVAGKEQKVQFKGTTEDGITYVWTYDCAKIQPSDGTNSALLLFKWSILSKIVAQLMEIVQVLEADAVSS